MNICAVGCWLLFLAVIPGTVRAVDYHLSPSGADSNPGTLERPFQTLARAQAAVRGHVERGKQPITVQLGGGTYYLDETLVFTPEDSGTAEAPVTWAARDGAKVVLSGGMKLELKWVPLRPGLFRAQTPEGVEIDQLFIDGERQHMARYPNYDPEVAVYNGFAADAFSLERAAGWINPAGGYIHAMHKQRWGGYHYRITGKNDQNEVEYEGGWQNNRQMGMHPEHRFVENIYEELDAPGEWFHDTMARTLYFQPAAGVDLKKATVEVARLPHLIELRGGGQADPVRHLELRGLVFRHAARTFMETKEPLLRSDWAIYRGGAVVIDGAEDCAIVDCEFDQVGGNAVFVNNYNRRIAVRGSHIHGAGASGVCFVGDPNAVRNPLFEYNETQSLEDIDLTPGPKTDNFPADCVVEDCLIHDISMVEKQAAGVQISMAQGITVRHCSIYDIGRAGINVSEGTFGGHLIEFCDVFDTVRETHDHGSFNSWGRDRFWHLQGAPPEQLPELAKLDTEKTIIRNSRWRCDHGWDIDLDDGSSHYEIYNNLCLQGGIKLREGFNRHVYNNVTVNNTLHPHVWYADCGDRVHQNIWMRAYRPARMKWDGEVDNNFFTSEADMKAFNKQQWDLESTSGDPQFLDPATGDYRVAEGSPALKAGFVNFPMDQFGVRKPELKAIARTPDLPQYVPVAKPRRSARAKRSVPQPAAAPQQWLGATVAALQGEEFSAFGVSSEDGGIHLVTVPEGSAAAQAGFEAGDVVQKVAGKPVRTVAELAETTNAAPAGQPLAIDYVRGQVAQSLTQQQP